MLFAFVVLLAANSAYAQTQNAANSAYAKTQNDVTLVVSADGLSKDEATKTALRSAIEQAYGTFVSANTTILNDELVKDEIVTVASGNIKEYKEIACEQMPNGKMFVTLQATVSISNLISYAQSKGAETEFAGATFAMNMKLKELNKQNELKVVENMCTQLKTLKPLYDVKIVLDNPIIDRTNYKVMGKIYYYYNENTKLINDLVYITLSSLSLSEQERLEYEKIGLKYYKWDGMQPTIAINGSLSADFLIEDEKPVGKPICFYLRNENVVKNIYSAIKDSYILSDNLSSPTKLQYHISSKPKSGMQRIERVSGLDIILQGNKNKRIVLEPRDPTPWGYCYLEEEKLFSFKSKKPSVKHYRKIGDLVGVRIIEIFIPKEDISKYTNFKLESK